MEIELMVHEEKDLSTESDIKTEAKENDQLTKKQSTTCCWIDRTYFRIEPSFIKFKCFFFFFLGAIGAMFPFFSVFYKQLGFSPNEIGIVSGVRPMVRFFSGPLWGFLADRFRISRVVLIGSTFAWLVCYTSVGFVPPPSKTDINCPLVYELLSNNSVRANDSAQIMHLSPTHSGFYIARVLRLRPDVTPAESLQQDRGWMFDQDDVKRVFITILVLVLVGEFLQAPCEPLADSAIVGELGDEGIDKYGYQRAFGSLSLGLFSMFMGGAIITTRKMTVVCGVEIVDSDYRIVFYTFAGKMACCFITVWFFKFKEQQYQEENTPKPNPLKVFRMFLTVHYGSWLICVLFTGVCNGVIWGFLFWHIENIGGTQLLIGLATTVCHFSEVVMFFLVFIILKFLSPFTFMILGLLGFCVRFSIFATMSNPWLILPTEVLQGFSFAGVWFVYTKQLCASVPSEYLGTLQGLLHGVYWGLGAGSGFLIGGVLVQNYGARVTFWIFAIGSFINLIIFAIAQKVSKRPNMFENYEELKN
ncbi:hypothetical protein CHS0354_019009 [Potamilus streckersoni]|uniref:Major facilitator superfamily associated domain-containing protein n=1 Tax=Potamilus streckersoni TaxID=2493646 RepID=A0AAE0SRS9_9BIVA|nr:hypothetical protein CHS0354_019009 [Potamilus streckersoni]